MGGNSRGVVVYGSAVRPAELSTQLEPRGTYHDLLARLRGDESGKVPGGRCSSLLLLPFYIVKMHIPNSRRTLPHRSSNAISRSPLSIRALRSARNERIRLRTIFVRKSIADFPAQSRPLARLVQDDGSRKLPQISQTNLCDGCGQYQIL